MFLLTLSAYVTITLLGGPRSKLLVSMIYDSVVSFQWPRAAALAFILLAIALALTGVIMRRAATGPRPGNRTMKLTLSPGRVVCGGATVVAFVLILAPILVVVVAGVFADGLFPVSAARACRLRWFVEFFRLDNMRNAFTLSWSWRCSSATLATDARHAGRIISGASPRRDRQPAAIAVSRRRWCSRRSSWGLALLLLYKTIGMPVFPGCCWRIA